MTLTKVRLTIDSSAEDELARAKLIDLHQIVVDQVMRLKINESVKVTIEYGGADLEDRLSSQAVASGEKDGDDLQSGKMDSLSERQRQIAEMLCNHYSIKRIAEELYVSVNTVKKHIQNMKKVLNIDVSGADFIYTVKKILQYGGSERKVMLQSE
ncbi:LuxR C-terminal-related transcriptional regulator [Paenibacillus chondroitinus]|uniref:LuxR C-terminal-related transcriptional regulator n=1 Tax=Paenibacillus chondroitinus TaxID=59842 RepID=A0ABU6DLG7_9BACL|nr:MULTISPECIES: LuxR C-terminal-related transcriptional regulator [Paenibacillus]MCY9662429.1 LuxR C-terminal-related transcriptional regulator [Paenibacillus anseongense]MEB4798578.1 LuxR C-terminal-related transcriptional regulator [Paenibacillus chondroitinus]